MSKNAKYIAERTSNIFVDTIGNDLPVSEYVSKLIGRAMAASVVVSVELSTAILMESLAQLDLIEHDGHPNLRVINND